MILCKCIDWSTWYRLTIRHWYTNGKQNDGHYGLRETTIRHGVTASSGCQNAGAVGYTATCVTTAVNIVFQFINRRVPKGCNTLFN